MACIRGGFCPVPKSTEVVPEHNAGCIYVYAESHRRTSSNVGSGHIFSNLPFRSSIPSNGSCPPSLIHPAAMSSSIQFNPLQGLSRRSRFLRRGSVSCHCSASDQGLKQDRADVIPQVSAITATDVDLLNIVPGSSEKQWLSRPVGGVATSSAEQFVPVSKLAVADDVELPSPSLVDRIMASAPVLFYMRNLEQHPLSTKCWTSFTGFFIGDVMAQLLTEPDFVISRTLILAGYGFFIDAPVGNAFYTWIDARIHPEDPKSAKAEVCKLNDHEGAGAVGKKIAIDQLLYAPVLTCVLYAFLCAAHLDFDGIPIAIQDKVWPTLLANWCIWPLAHGLNFYFVPTEQRILYNNFVAVCWTTWLSFLAH